MTWQIIQGDCLEVMRGMDANSVDAVVTDPPYAVGLNKTTCGWDKWPDGDVWVETFRIVKPDGRMAFSIAPNVAHERVPDVLAAGWQVLEVGFWVYGAGRPVNKDRLKRCYDLVYFCTKGNRQMNINESRLHNKANSITGRQGTIKPAPGAFGRQFHTLNKQHTYICGEKNYHPANVACLPDSDAFGQSQYDLIFAVKRMMPVGHANEKHPTQKPLDLIAQIVRLVSTEGETILDPFTGSGTTGLASIQLGRKFLGIELNPDYCDIARRRIAHAAGEDLPLVASHYRLI